MSKLMGKLLLKSMEEDENGVSSSSLRIRYLKVTDSFEFEGERFSVVSTGMSYEDLGETKRVKVKREVLEALIEADSVDDLIYKWSTGYKTRMRKGVSEMQELRKGEMGFVCAYVGCGTSDSDSISEVYEDVCVWQYVFNLSFGLLTKAKRAWKRYRWGRNESMWINVERCKGYKGRKKGAVARTTTCRDSVGLSLSEVEHNLRVARKKERYDLFEEAYSMQCKLLGEKFERQKCLRLYKELP